MLEPCETHHYRAGHLLPDRSGLDALSFVASGYLRIFATDSHGERWVRYLVQPGKFLASVDTLLRGTPASERVQCITDCTLLTISKQSLNRLADQPALLLRLQEVTIRILTHIARDRSDMLPMNATERYNHFLNHYPGMIDHVPLGDIASFIGIRQQSLSRIRRQQRDQRILREYPALSQS